MSIGTMYFYMYNIIHKSCGARRKTSTIYLVILSKIISKPLRTKTCITKWPFRAHLDVPILEEMLQDSIVWYSCCVLMTVTVAYMWQLYVNVMVTSSYQLAIRLYLTI